MQEDIYVDTTTHQDIDSGAGVFAGVKAKNKAMEEEEASLDSEDESEVTDDFLDNE